LLEEKTEAAQFAVLKKYGVLADFSDLEAAEINRVLRLGVSKADARYLTLAQWCDQLIGPGCRVPVARFELAPGQTQVANLAIGAELAAYVGGREREHTNEVRSGQEKLQALEEKHAAEVRAYKTEITKLENEVRALKEANAAKARQPEYRDPIGLSGWYGRIVGPLHEVLGGVRELEGAIFESQGPYNRNYRETLVNIHHGAMLDLQRFGCSVFMRFAGEDLQRNRREVILYREGSFSTDNEYCEKIRFAITDVPLDVLRTLSEEYPTCDVTSDFHPQARFEWHVDVHVREDAGLSKEELFHFGCFLRTLSEAVAKSGDHRPRASLREKIILCELLYRTAPCTLPYQPDREMPSLLRAVSAPREAEASLDGWEASAQMIVSHLDACVYGYRRY
jgi:hypothetical protein